jgi:hypothetical protein
MRAPAGAERIDYVAIAIATDTHTPLAAVQDVLDNYHLTVRVNGRAVAEAALTQLAIETPDVAPPNAHVYVLRFGACEIRGGDDIVLQLNSYDGTPANPLPCPLRMEAAIAISGGNLRPICFPPELLN